MGGGQTGECRSGQWIAGILEGEYEKLEQCRQQLEAQEKKPYVIAQKCYGTGGKKECGFEVKPDPICTPQGGQYDSWFSSAKNTSDAQSCAERLRRLGYDASVNIVHRNRWIGISAEVVVTPFMGSVLW